MIKKITQTRFEALSYARIPYVKMHSNEIEWYSSEDNRVLGIILKDTIDNDYSFVVMGRDSDGVFKGIDLKVSLETKDSAVNELKKSMLVKVKEDSTDHYQDKIKEKIDIYKITVKESKLNKYFQLLLNDERFTPAKEIIGEAVYAFKDPDGNYVEQFQSTGFNSRLWELYLFAYFHENDFILNNKFSSPDFLVSKYRDYAFEAVTVNQSLASPPPPLPISNTEKSFLNKDFMPIRYGSALYTKLNKRYWEKDHVKGKPLVIAIHDYHYEDSMTWSRNALETYLYGINQVLKVDEHGKKVVYNEEVESHTWKNKTIPSNFFSLEDAKHISAILFSNTATIIKFNRMGYLADFGDKNIKMIRFGVSYDPNVNAMEPISFERNLDSSSYKETWSEGIVMFHNPNASIPIHPNEFPEISHVMFRDGQWLGSIVENTPLSSKTLVTLKA